MEPTLLISSLSIPAMTITDGSVLNIMPMEALRPDELSLHGSLGPERLETDVHPLSVSVGPRPTPCSVEYQTGRIRIVAKPSYVFIAGS